MNQRYLRGMITAVACFLAAAAWIAGTETVDAAEKPAYTITKGKKVTIYNIIKKNPLTKSKKNTYKNLKWKSGNKKIVRVVGKKIKGVKKGKVYIRGYNKSGKKRLAIRVTVGKKVTSIKPDSTNVVMQIGDKKKLSVKISPSRASNKKVFYSSSKPAVATVSAAGRIKAVSSGKTVITICSKDGSKTKKVNVKVQSALIRTTTKGRVKGVEEENGKALVWYGVPYGASTAGVNRWKAPKPVSAWSGIRSAETPREGAAQYSSDVSYSGTEDCLYVNIYRPNTSDQTLPVMVYLHGGGNAGGNANESFSSMAAAANAVVVSVEYRVGAFGFLSHEALRDGTPEENSGNFALLDIKAALTWVRDEIANFGGNAGNVTLSGFSAGARNAMLCLISPAMKGLFHKAVIFNGGCTTCTNEDGEKSVNDKLASILVKRGTYATKEIAKKYIGAASNSEIRVLLDSLTTAEVAGMYSSSGLRLGKFPQCFADGVVVPKEGFEVIKSGNYNRVPIIFGSDASEFSSYAWSGTLTSKLPELGGALNTAQLEKLVADAVKYGSMLQSEFYIEKPAALIESDPSHASVYAFRFLWGTDPGVTDDFYSKYVGAYHGAAKDFLRNVYRNMSQGFSPGVISSANKSGRQELTGIMQKYIGNFLASGNPNGAPLVGWSTWNSVPGASKLMVFNSNQTRSISGMSSEMYSESVTFDWMRANLTELEYGILVGSLFDGRFFMPEHVPSYRSAPPTATPEPGETEKPDGTAKPDETMFP